MFQHLLVPIDGSPLSERAIGASVELAARLGATITGFVVEPDIAVSAPGGGGLAQADAAATAHARRLLAPLRAAARAAGVRFRSHCARTDHIDEAIIAAAEARRCDLIVMVTHGRGAFGERLFGSHTKRVMAGTAVPLLVLH